MANSDKDIVVTPNKGSSTADPKIVFTGNSGSTTGSITLNVYPQNSGTLSFEGTSGQLFSVANTMSGTIFSVNDISGIPSIEVIDDGTVRIARFSGNVGIGVATPTSKLTVSGNMSGTRGDFTSLYVNGVSVSAGGTPTSIVSGNYSAIANVNTRLVSFQSSSVEKAYITDAGSAYFVSNVQASNFYGPYLAADTVQLIGTNTDGAGVVATQLRSLNTLAGSGARIVNFTNNSTVKAYVDKDGNFSGSRGDYSSLYINGSAVTIGGAATSITSGNFAVIANSNGRLASFKSGSSENAFVLPDGGAFFSGSTAIGTTSNIGVQSFAVGDYFWVDAPTGNAEGHAFVSNNFAASSGFLTLWGAYPDSQYAVSVSIDSSEPLSTNGSKILSVNNAGYEKLAIDHEGALILTAVSISNSMYTPPGGSGMYYARDRAAIVPEWNQPSGFDFSLQRNLASGHIHMWSNPGASTTPNLLNLVAPTTTGTAGAASITSTNLTSSLKRIDYAAAGGSGATSGLYGANANWWRGNTAGAGGFYFVTRFIWPKGVVGGRMFCGFLTGNAAPTNLNPSAYLNSIGIGKDAGDSTYQFMHNDGTGTATKTNTSITATNGDLLEARIYCVPSSSLGSSTVMMTLEKLNANLFAKYDSTTSTDFPANNVFLNYYLFTMSTGSNATTMSPISIYLETEY